MAQHVKDDADASITKDSVFDWGGASSVGKGEESKQSSAGPSRYDPKAMSRIVDINDLVDDDDGSSDDEDNVIPGQRGASSALPARPSAAAKKKGGNEGDETRRYGLGGRSNLACRQVLVLAALAAVVVGASVAIGYAVTGRDEDGSAPSNVRGSAGSQKLLETAERIVTACAESKLDDDMSECQKLCKRRMCCFEAGEYSCADDEKKDCGVYGGCAALMEGVPVDAAEEDEE